MMKRRHQEVRGRVIRLAALTALLVAVTVGPALATSPVTSFLISPVGTVIVCPYRTYTIVSGEFIVREVSTGTTFHLEAGPAPGDPGGQVTLTSSGEIYYVRGTDAAHATATEDLYVANLEIIAAKGGGLADVDHAWIRTAPDGSILAVQRGTCEFD
jgi:hypothetical protein